MIDLAEELAQLERLRERTVRQFPGWISHIRFPRFKNLAPNTEIKFTFPLTALVGSNGSGKTSVLTALYGAPKRYSVSEFWFSTKVDPIEEGEGTPNRIIYGHYNNVVSRIVETRKARVSKYRNGRRDPDYWEPTKESPGDGMEVDPTIRTRTIQGRSLDRWNPVQRNVLYINFRKELSAFDKYFYFGRDPEVDHRRRVAAARDAGRAVPNCRIVNKQSRVREDSARLMRVIQNGDTSEKLRGQKVATENRLLTNDELRLVSYVLGRDYEEARWIKHRLFQSDDGLSIVFRTRHGRYSEAFAGSGEVAATSCIVQVLAARSGTLLLLDEPEVSLHPGAQERLLAFLAQAARRKQMQVVFSTHSPHLISALPDDAIKSFYQMPDGRFGVIQRTHPYAAFRRLGDVRRGCVQVIVEDRLAQKTVLQAIATIEDEATRGLFKVDFVQGGASSMLANRVPVLMEREGNFLVLLDGDQKRVDEVINPDSIPATEDGALEEVVNSQVGVKPVLLVDGSRSTDNAKQRADFYRRYLAWTRSNVRYIPRSCPEELILRATGVFPEGATSAREYKDTMRERVAVLLGREPSSEDIDFHAEAWLANRRGASEDLALLRATLLQFLETCDA